MSTAEAQAARRLFVCPRPLAFLLLVLVLVLVLENRIQKNQPLKAAVCAANRATPWRGYAGYIAVAAGTAALPGGLRERAAQRRGYTQHLPT